MIMSDDGLEATLITLTGVGEEGPPAPEVTHELLRMLATCRAAHTGPVNADQELQLRLREVLGHIQETGPESLRSVAAGAF